MFENDEKFMREAIRLARRAERIGEVPIGACLVDEAGEILTGGFNQTILRSDPTAHAEILCLRRAGEIVRNYRLTEMTVYTTIEPCVMCAGALVNARIKRLVFGAHDKRFGAVESIFRLCDNDSLNHRMEIASAVLEDECRRLMQDFFRAKRLKT